MNEIDDLLEDLLDDLLDDLIAEKSDLNLKIASLVAFVDSTRFNKLVPNQAERQLIRHQLAVMQEYRSTLRERIKGIEMDKRGKKTATL